VLPEQPQPGIIKCSCITVSLDDSKRPAYVAISYTWGDPTPTNEMLIDNKRFGVTKNVVDLLSSLTASILCGLMPSVSIRTIIKSGRLR
jgi:Heterokaryon incompatibility protein (HET)